MVCKRVTKRIALVCAVLILILGMCGFTQAGVRLVLMGWEDDYNPRSYYQAVKALFEKKNPGIEVVIKTVPYDGYVQKLLVEYAAGAGPDVFMSTSSWLGQFSRNKAVLAIDGYVTREVLGDYPTSLVNANTRDGKLYALPLVIYPGPQMIYNKRLFAEAGINPPTDHPWTYQEFIDNMVKLNRFDGSGRQTRFALYTYFWELWPMMWGASFADDPVNPKRFNYTTPEMMDGLQAYIDLHTKYKILIGSRDIDALQLGKTQLFLQEKVAAILDCWYVGASLRGAPLEWGIAWPPMGPKNNVVQVGFDKSFMIMASTKHPDAAAKLAMFLNCDPESVGAYMNAVGGNVYDPFMPARKSVARSKAFLESGRLPMNKNMLVQMGEFARYWPDPSFGGEQWWMDFRQVLPKVIAGKGTLKEEMESLQSKHNKLLEEE